MKRNGDVEWIPVEQYLQWICTAEEAERYIATLKDQGYTKIVVVPIEMKGQR